MREKIIKIVKENWRLWYGLYVFIYFPWFFWLEKKITITSPGIHILNTSLDEAIPFIEWFIIPYTLWALYVVATVVVFYFKANDIEYRHLAISLISGMSIALFICMIFPNGLTLRPDSVSDSILGQMVAKLYTSDTSTNVFPSIHVLNSLIVTYAIVKSELVADKKYFFIKAGSIILCILICLSTIFLKQHCLYDVIGGILLFWLLTNLIYNVDYAKIKSKIEIKLNERRKAKEYIISNNKKDY